VPGLYLHIPFCEHKCIYCDFYSIETLDPVDEFIVALKREIAEHPSAGSAELYSTIFFGGGTPSLLEPRVISDLIGLLHKSFHVETDAEITLEANPGTVDSEKLMGYRAAGVNRLSFGIQSFHNDDLRFLTRIHSSEQAIRGVRSAREAGFENVSLDLIFALPGQTMGRWEQNLRQAVELEPSHISAYSLIVEPKTPLFEMVKSRQVSTLPIETEAEQYEFTMQYLHDAGYEHYEVSNYARPGYRSRHNCGYWNHSNYIGFGPSAHSFRENRRWWNTRSVRAYCDALAGGKTPVAGSETLTKTQLLDEAVMLGLRGEGLDLARLRASYGVDLLKRKCSEIEEFKSAGIVVLDGQTLRLTDRGYLLCDEICELLLARVDVDADSLRLFENSSILTANAAG
jgi:oxygen-independent coproporphyrinogen-3 oxidase